MQSPPLYSRGAEARIRELHDRAALRSELAFAKSIKGMRERTTLATITAGGMEERIELWNTYMVSMMQHAARCVAIRAAQISEMRNIASKMIAHTLGYSWTILTDLKTSIGISHRWFVTFQ